MKVMIDDNIFKVKLCSTSSSISEGMMGKTFNSSFNGMFFMMPESTEQSFWMYDCLIPLDIIIIDNGVISTIHHNCPPCENENSCKSYKGYGGEVLEIEGGTCKKVGIKKGDRVSLSLF
jgi:uncharacterized membrane protein (UPF0127 family)